jgi:ATP-dependent helicase/nuclease subunit B
MTLTAAPVASPCPDTDGERLASASSSPHWHAWVPAVRAAAQACQADPGRTLVLVPYAQLMDAGRRAWAQAHPSGFPPRFETTRNWATSLQPFAPGPTDLSMDMARDSLVAAAFVERVAPARTDPALRAVMVGRLVQAARQLVPLAAAVPPEERLAWAAGLNDALALSVPSLQWESLLASLALAWVSTSAFATDVLWGPLASPGAGLQALVVLQGFQQDPLASALALRWGACGVVLSLPGAQAGGAAAPRLHPCGDAEDEAQRATACVLAHVAADRVPVALVANDRQLTRRVSAMLHAAGLVLVDETGWKLSTTHAAAQLMSLLRAADGRANMDEVLDLLKQSPVWPEAQVLTLEQLAREVGVSLWRAALQTARLAPALPVGLADVLQGLQASRPLERWLQDLRAALQSCGLWDGLLADPAGVQMLQSLRLQEGASDELQEVGQALAVGAAAAEAAAGSGKRLSLAGFTAWVREVLEGASFMPRSQGDADVLILPLAQLLGRRFAATVVPGCDEVHLNPSPELPGQWTSAQREALGLPARELLAQAAHQAWQNACQMPQTDLLWRTQERGEALLPSPWVQALMPVTGSAAAPDPRGQRWLSPLPTQRPAPTAAELMPASLSASAYQDLRDCPYRFFALRQLRLSEAPELQAEPDQRDMGNWLHAVLRGFHEERGQQRPGLQADQHALDRWALATAERMGLNAGEGGAGFLPYQAVWPALRDGYLQWLFSFEAGEQHSGPQFDKAEWPLSAQAGPYQLFGKLDRVDQQSSPEGQIAFVIDYKTESRTTTTERVKEPLEDTQLAFYAALLPSENVRAAYLSITDKRGDGPREQRSLLLEQTEVLMAREQLLQGIQHDMLRIQGGHSLAALGEGRVCGFCAARGLCRKDFW